MAIQILYLEALGGCFQADSGCWQNFVTKHAGYITGEQQMNSCFHHRTAKNLVHTVDI